jgi:ubiquinone/menaquinone biosynthesis C-methylase UbiE
MRNANLRRRLLILASAVLPLALLLFPQSCLRAQAAAQTAAPKHPTSTPYSGPLDIFEDPGRADRLQINRVMDVLRLKPGKTIADIGAGGGWFTVRAAKRVGPTGKVFAEDINTNATGTIRDRAAREHFTNIEPVLGTPDDPRLPADSLDAALMLHVYHEVAHPPVLLAHLRAALKPGGLFGVIDHDGRGDDHGINANVVRAEVERSGLHFLKRYDFVSGDQNDYMLVFEKR